MSPFATVIKIMKDNGVHILAGWIELASKQIDKELAVGLSDSDIGVYFYFLRCFERHPKNNQAKEKRMEWTWWYKIMVSLYVCGVTHFIQWFLDTMAAQKATVALILFRQIHYFESLYVPHNDGSYRTHPSQNFHVLWPIDSTLLDHSTGNHRSCSKIHPCWLRCYSIWLRSKYYFILI